MGRCISKCSKQVQHPVLGCDAEYYKSPFNVRTETQSWSPKTSEVCETDSSGGVELNIIISAVVQPCQSAKRLEPNNFESCKRPSFYARRP